MNYYDFNNPYGWMNGNQFGVPTYGYGPQQSVPSQNQPPIQVPQVHGENGAKAYSLPPNSSILLMDETDEIVWAKMTDGAGYPTLKGFRITPIEDDVQDKKEDTPIYVTTKEFDKLKEKVDKLLAELGGDK